MPPMANRTLDGVLLLCSNFCAVVHESQLMEPFFGQHWVGTVGEFRAVYKRAKEDDYVQVSERSYDHLRVHLRHLVVRLGQLLLGEDVLRRLPLARSNAAGSATA